MGGCIGILDSWNHREVMIKCDQEQSLKSLAELYREQRRPRSRMEENTHCDMEGLARTRRSDRCERRCKITFDVVAGEKTGLEFDGVCHGCCLGDGNHVGKQMVCSW